MLHKIYLPFLLLLAIACGNNESSDRKDGFTKGPQSAEDSLFDEVMHGHDTAMAKMGKLGRYKKEVTAKLDSLKKVGGKKWADVGQSLNGLKTDLQQAEDGMNKWMEDFDIDSAQDNIERRLEYLKNEKIKVDEVKRKIFQTLDKADSILSR